MKKTTKRLLAVAVAAGLAMPMAANATNGYFAHGYGTKNKALGGAGVALPQDAMAAATNPAGMVFVGDRMDLGLALFSPQREYTASNVPPAASPVFEIPPGNVESDSEYFFIPHFARNWMLDANSAVGLTIYGNGGMNTDYPNIDVPGGHCGPGSGTFCAGAAGVDLMQLFVNASYSRKINDTSSWGASAILAYQRFEATGLGSFAGSSSDPANLSNNGYDDSMGFGVKLGWQGEVAPGLTLGTAYQSKVSMDEFDKYKGLFAEQGGFDIPATWTVGLAYDMGTSGTVLFDIQKIEYSGVAAISNPMLPALGACGMGDTTQCLGTAGGPGFGWEDITVYKLGYQWSTSPDWIWRVGYNHGDQPIPNSEVVFNILAPGVMQDHLTFGFTKTMSPTSEFNFAAMYAPSNSVTGANPLSASGQQIELKMTQWELEASYAWKF